MQIFDIQYFRPLSSSYPIEGCWEAVIGQKAENTLDKIANLLQGQHIEMVTTGIYRQF